MKFPISSRSLAVLVGIALTSPAFAVVNIDYVPVGHAGNAADPSDGDQNTAGVQNFGAVAYAYKIGQYEVTNAQYTEFLNAADSTGENANGIYNTNMGSNARGGISFNVGSANGSKYTIRTDMGSKPVNFVSWYDAARFTNWLNNGQGSGSTETGAYDLSLTTPGKSVGATVWLPSENEWYKAAYYDPTVGAGGGDNYWTYATQSDTAPTVAAANTTGDVSNPGANVANYASGADWGTPVVQNGNVTTVGSAAANNYFGTADMNGNVREWNDAVIGSSRGLRGGSWVDGSINLTASFRSGIAPTNENSFVGFRVASVPEPSAVLMTFLAVAASLTRRRRNSL